MKERTKWYQQLRAEWIMESSELQVFRWIIPWNKSGSATAQPQPSHIQAARQLRHCVFGLRVLARPGYLALGVLPDRADRWLVQWLCQLCEMRFDMNGKIGGLNIAVTASSRLFAFTNRHDVLRA